MPLFTLLGGRRMAVSGHLALVDLSDPAWPRVTANLDRHGYIADVAALGERFFVARHLGGVQELRAEPDGGLRPFAETSEPAGRLAIDPKLGRLYLGFASSCEIVLDPGCGGRYRNLYWSGPAMEPERFPPCPARILLPRLDQRQ